MRILVITYIKSDLVMGKVEGIMNYDKFQIIETNQNFRVFRGYINSNVNIYFKKLFQQLEAVEFDIEDSLFMASPGHAENKQPTISTLVLKRKGNKHLRRLEYK